MQRYFREELEHLGGIESGNRGSWIKRSLQSSLAPKLRNTSVKWEIDGEGSPSRRVQSPYLRPIPLSLLRACQRTGSELDMIQLAFLLLLFFSFFNRTVGSGPSSRASTRYRSSSSSGSNIQQQILNILAFERLLNMLASSRWSISSVTPKLHTFANRVVHIGSTSSTCAALIMLWSLSG